MSYIKVKTKDFISLNNASLGALIHLPGLVCIFISLSQNSLVIAYPCVPEEDGVRLRKQSGAISWESEGAGFRSPRRDVEDGFRAAGARGLGAPGELGASWTWRILIQRSCRWATCFCGARWSALRLWCTADCAPRSTGWACRWCKTMLYLSCDRRWKWS